MSNKYSYAVWSTIQDNKACEVCKELDQLHWIPDLPDTPQKPPHPNCKNPKGCRCIAVDWNDSETFAFIRMAGGKATFKQIEELEEKKYDPIRKQQEKLKISQEKSSLADDMKKSEPEKAILLYRESIEIRIKIAEKSKDKWNWRDLDYLYNKLTMLLEKQGNYEEALNEINKCKKLKHKELWIKSITESINKRELRLKKKLQK